MDEDTTSRAKSLSQDRFGRFADGYVSSQTHAAASELELLRQIAAPQPHWTVLDVATGGGHTALAFQPFVRRVVASDLTWRMLASARAHSQQVIESRCEGSDMSARLEFHQADAEALPYAVDSFDLVTCRIAPHHFPQAGLFVQEAARIIKPGGMLLVQDHLLPEDPEACDYLNTFERLRDPSHQRSFTRLEWESMFVQAGLTVERVETVFKTHAFLPFVERQGCTPQVVAELAAMMREAPPVVRQWRTPRNFEGDLKLAEFSDRHIVIAGRKE